MKSTVNRAAALSLATLLAACGGGGHDSGALASTQPGAQLNGPAADYPMVLGQSYTIDGVSYTPVDQMNYDAAGYAGSGSGEGVSIAHRTLPIPSYAEVTSLLTGRTILVRVTERGPMTNARLIELSPAAAAQLGATGNHTPIRVRRVNPPEVERAMLRSGGQAPARMDTPMSLANVLRRKLDPNFAAGPGSSSATLPSSSSSAAHSSAERPNPAPTVTKSPAVIPPRSTLPTGEQVVQVGAFSNAASASAIAKKVGGSVMPAGKLFRVRMGPFANRGEAEAALAKARAAGYSDARIQRAD